MNNPIFVIGHKNPDTDSICSSLAYANLKQLKGENAVACRLGPLNEESKFVTKYFDIEGPLLIKDARSQLRDIVMDQPTMINYNATVNEAWNMVLGSKSRSLIVTNDEGKMKGIISTSNLATIRLLSDIDVCELMKSTKLVDIATTIEGQIKSNIKEFDISGEIFITTTRENADLFNLNKAICIVPDTKDLALYVIKKGAKCIVATCNQTFDDEIIKVAKENDCALIQTELETMKVSKLIYESIPIHLIMTPEPVFFLDHEYVNDVSKKIANSRFRSYPVLNEYEEIVGQVSRYHLQNYNRKKFILVDHSSINQSINNIEDAEIVEIIDHHHIGNIETDYPINFRNQKCGCTSTIIFKMYEEEGIIPNRTFAGVMLSAIISDTLCFKSLTTTEKDIETAKRLAVLAGVDLYEYAQELLSASIDIKDADLRKILVRDLKEYKMGKYKVAVGQTNYRNIEDIQVILDEFRQLLNDELNTKQYDLIIMMFTQVMAEGTMFVYSGPLSYIMEQMIETTFTEDSGYDPDIISRKQQLIPKMSRLLKRL